MDPDHETLDPYESLTNTKRNETLEREGAGEEESVRIRKGAGARPRRGVAPPSPSRSTDPNPSEKTTKKRRWKKKKKKTIRNPSSFKEEKSAKRERGAIRPRYREKEGAQNEIFGGIYSSPPLFSLVSLRPSSSPS